ncbi:GDSL-type esterase/lipase family protein [Humibacter albus]|uniref:GDSL-type esterase/lipase family protein n=1 Tax=Humibacter albus TaxID=427754 RepID=UPI0012FAC770|nr:GDSL-type esterase/lipase family protein [Humibacter albus]
MRRRTPAVRVHATAVALVIAALALTSCSSGHSDRSDPTGTSASTAAPTATISTPVPTPTSTLRKGTSSDPLRYVALGDSYSSGMGGGSAHGGCYRSPHAYAKLLAKAKSINLVAFKACAGATTEDVLRSQVKSLDDNVDLITITIGGNDLDVSTLPSVCGNGESRSCKAAVHNSVALLKTLPKKLEKTYAAIAKAAPNARILVADYPLFYDLPPITEKTIGSQELSAAVAVDAAVASLDATIADAVEKQQEAGTDIHFVDISFNGHGVNAKKPWFVLSGLEAFHPTATGYARYAKTLRPLTT